MRFGRQLFAYGIVLTFFICGCSGQSDFFVQSYFKTPPPTVILGAMPSLIAGNQGYDLVLKATPISPLTISSLTLTYTSDGTSYQSIATLQANATGYHWSVPAINHDTQLRLVAVDSSGNTSHADSTWFTVKTNPVLTLAQPAAQVRGGASLSVSYNASDAGSGISSLTLQLSWNGGEASSTSVSLDASQSIYALAIPKIDVSDAVITVTLQDRAGNQASVSSGAFQILSTIKSPGVALASPAQTNQNRILLTLSSCTGISKVFVNLVGQAQPALTNPSWVNCSTGAGAIVYNFPAVAGTAAAVYAPQVWATDTVGNISSAVAVSPTVVYDTLAPAINVTNPVAQIGNQTYTLHWTVTEADLSSARSFTVNYSKDGGNSWSQWGTATASSGPLSNVTFSISKALPADDTAQAMFQVSVTDLAGNIGTGTAGPFFVQTTLPKISFSFPNLSDIGGAPTTAQPFAKVSVQGTDPLGNPGIKQMQFAAVPSTSPCPATPPSSSWITFATDSTYFSSSNGKLNVCLWAQDQAGNLSAPASQPLIDDSGYPSLPTVKIIAPVANATYAPGQGQGVTIQWTCSPSSYVGLAADPVSIQYTVGDNATLYSIAPGEPANGSFTWTPPASVTKSTEFRILISCADAAGVTNSAFSQPVNAGDWNIFAGDPWNGLYGSSALISNLVPTGIASSAADSDGNIYYVKNVGILKIDAVTGVVSPFAGNINSGGSCNTSASGISFLMNGSVTILGMDAQNQSLLVYACTKIYKIAVASGAATLWSNPATITNGFSISSLQQWFLATSGSTQSLIYLNSDGVNFTYVYKLDLSTANNTPILIHGNATNGCPADSTITQYMQVGISALQVSPPTNSAVPCTSDFILFAKPDASQIWFEVYAGHSYRLDLKAGSTYDYVVGSNNEGWNQSAYAQYCVGAAFDPNNVYCGTREGGGANINAYNFTNKKWSRACMPLSDPYNADSATNPYSCTNGLVSGPISAGLNLAPMQNQILAYYSGNSMQTVVPQTDATGNVTFTWIANVAGQVLSTMGNSAPAPLGFEHPTNLQYIQNAKTGTNALVVRNPGYVRWLNIAQSDSGAYSYAGGSTVVTPENYTFGDHSAMSIFAGDSGNEVAFLDGCARFSILGGLLTSSAETSAGVSQFLLNSCTPYSSNEVQYPPASGTAANHVASFGGTVDTNGSSAGGILGTISESRTLLYHSSGLVYFTAATNPTGSPSDVFLFSSNRSVIDRVAGAGGVGSYSAIDASGASPSQVSLTYVSQLQEYTSPADKHNGDILFMDCYHLRSISVQSQASSPKVYDIADLTTALGGTAICNANTGLIDLVYDSSTETSGLGSGTLYYAMKKSNSVILGKYDLATGSRYTYNLNGTSPSGYVRLTLAPFGLLVLEPNMARIIQVAK